MDAIVLAGGRATRLGGADKASVLVGGRALLDRVLDALAGAETVVVVGPERASPRAVKWVLEHPPGGGPVAAIAAALPLVSSETVAVVATDLPFLEASHVAALSASVQGHDGAIVIDAEGRIQPLAGVYRTSALRAAVARLGEVSGASVHSLTRSLDLARVEEDRAAIDCDTPEDVAGAEAALRR